MCVYVCVSVFVCVCVCACKKERSSTLAIIYGLMVFASLAVDQVLCC